MSNPRVPPGIPYNWRYLSNYPTYGLLTALRFGAVYFGIYWGLGHGWRLHKDKIKKLTKLEHLEDLEKQVHSLREDIKQDILFKAWLEQSPNAHVKQLLAASAHGAHH